MERYLEPDAPVLGAIRLLLLPLVPIEFFESVDGLVHHVARHPDVGPHAHKLWGDLSESERAAIKREVHIVARSVGGG